MDPGSERDRSPGAPAPEHGAAWIGHNFPPRLPAGEVRTAWLAIENRGTATWEQGSTAVSVGLEGTHIARLDLPHPVGPGERVLLHWVFRTTPRTGRHTFTFDLGLPGVPPLQIPVRIGKQPTTPTGRLRDRVLENHARCWLVGDGMTWSSDGPGYPQFAREARGCRIIDLEGRAYVDYLMGWGSALLGHADERIQRAVGAALSSGGIPTLTHPWMPEVAERLRALFPGAEAATFGKNGSDVCTAAVRLARVFKGRPVVLFCGYHGWQDWAVERFGFAATGVPVRGEPLLVPFRPNDREQVAQLFAAHRGRVAAVMLEPAGVIEGSNGPIQEADPAFLQELAALARSEGALVVFDEILTGFRHPGGSVQHATGVVPDLTCLGKALASGLPLSALIGRREIFDAAIGRIHYEPTFKGEAYSFAAAREALDIYREQDIPARIGSFGNRLRRMIHRICADVRLPAEVIGPPYRMMLVFREENARRRTLMRTLVHQELLRQGVLTTQNLLLPSAAHDEEALEATHRAFAHALERLAVVLEEDSFVTHLEIPPLPG